MDKLSNKDVFDRYNTLYDNMYIHNPTVFLTTPLFCFVRCLLGVATGLFFKINIVPCLFVLFGSSVFQIYYYHKFQPMKRKNTNRIEVINFGFIYLSTYSLIIFSPWLSDLEFNYRFGFIYTDFLIAFCIFHLCIIATDIFFQIKSFLKKQKLTLKRKK